MKCLIITLATIVVLWMNFAAAVRIIPEYWDVIYCLSQPCITLDDLLLNNNLSNISNVEFMLLPGVYNVASNIVMQYVHNVSFVGVLNKPMGVILNCFYRTSLQIICSYNVTISNSIFELCGWYSYWIPSICPVPINTFIVNKEFDLLVSYSPSLRICCVLLFHFNKQCNHSRPLAVWINKLQYDWNVSYRFHYNIYCKWNKFGNIIVVFGWLWIYNWLCWWKKYHIC